MSREVWISTVIGTSAISNMLGIREKYYGEDWQPPTHIIPDVSKDVIKNSDLHLSGVKLPRSAFPEACYVFDEARWRRVPDLFYAGPFHAVKGRLAEVLKGFDLGGGELMEFPIYKADKTTRLEGPFYFLNYGAQRDTFVPSESKGLRELFTLEFDNREVWKYGRNKDDEIAVSAEALGGPDLWFEKKLDWVLFMSGRLHDAIVNANINVDFRFSRAKILT
jgi:hypothetical protein